MLRQVTCQKWNDIDRSRDSKPNSSGKRSAARKRRSVMNSKSCTDLMREICRNKDGSILKNERDVTERWRQHFDEHLNGVQAENQDNDGSDYVSAVNNEDVPPPTIGEVRNAITAEEQQINFVGSYQTALHWAAKHGSEDVIKLVAGTLKADVNTRTNGGYTALHIAMQFGRNDIFELLCNVYKADRDLLDWSGKKPLEYQKQMTSVSASTYSSEYDPMFIVNERFHSLPSKKILSPLARGGTFMRKKSRRQQRPSTTTGVDLQRTHSMLTMITPEHLSLATNTSETIETINAYNNDNSNATNKRINYLTHPADAMSLGGSAVNLRRSDKSNQSFFRQIKARKKHTEKDSGFLRIGSLNVRVKKTTEAFSNFLGVGTNTTRLPANMRTSAPPNSTYFEKIHKSWGSADNIPHEDGTMPPPKYGSIKKRRPKRDTDHSPANDQFSQSVPTTPSQTRAPIGMMSENPDTESENPGDSDSDTACGFDSNWRPTYI
ncbi:uncharacterized protein LOC129766491 [Toxorhynchites rutilus septentrionalis]|uniref:uncharacterized protein LOC129766491 n=1 Tax=Toxorhynchites rutilus septentrionalis TaxID=329112 RepID=UPI00247AECF0|nr:uncharacterized protein LOC129766491 [Toxorhynchites rutilus septentrionalis]